MSNLIDHLVFRARLEPGAVAIQGIDRELTFGQLLYLVKIMANRLRQSGIEPGQVVITSIGDKYLDWIVTLALSHEAAISCSIQRYSPLVASKLDYSWVITDRAVDHFAPEKTILADNNWLNGLKNLPPDIEAIYHQSEADINRIILTSGTTGDAKSIAISYSNVLQRAKNSLQYTCNVSSFISLFHISTGLGLNNAVISLIRGTPFYCSKSFNDAIDLINKYSIEGVHGSVIQIDHLINEAISSKKYPSSLKTVIYAGSAASPSFLKNVSATLTGNIYNDYGSTETAGLCTFKPNHQTDPAICGFPYPDVDIQVVGENHEPLSRGEEGLLRFKRAHMIDGYFNEPQSSTKFFRDGWFYPGDRGCFNKDGLLILTGRDSEVINLGGAKVDPVAIEHLLSDCHGIEDAAVFGLERERGVQQIAAAIVVADDFDMDSLKKLFAEKLPPLKRPACILRVKHIPRNQTGKVMRDRLSREFSSLFNQ